jgi:hypothetical protein
MPLALSLLAVRPHGGFTEAVFSIVASGNYTTGGDTLDTTTLAGQNDSNGRALATNPSTPPVKVDIESQGGTDYGYKYKAGASQSAGKLQVYAPGGTEISQAAYPGAVTGDTIVGTALFKTFQ